jgi:hypothetical protein
MAHVYKRLKTRISSCIEAAVDLRCVADGQDAAIMDICIERLRRAQDEISAILHGDEKARKAPRKPAARPAVAVTRPAVAAQPAPASSPMAEAEHRAPKTWAGREMQRADDDDEFACFPPGGSDELWVEYALRGKVGGVSTGEAAKQLAADTATWSVMDARERRAAIKALAEKMDADYLDGDDSGGVKF